MWSSVTTAAKSAPTASRYDAPATPMLNYLLRLETQQAAWAHRTGDVVALLEEHLKTLKAHGHCHESLGFYNANRREIPMRRILTLLT